MSGRVIRGCTRALIRTSLAFTASTCHVSAARLGSAWSFEVLSQRQESRHVFAHLDIDDETFPFTAPGPACRLCGSAHFQLRADDRSSRSGWYGRFGRALVAMVRMLDACRAKAGCERAGVRAAYRRWRGCSNDD